MSSNERAGAGCLGLVFLPLFLSTLFGAFVGAGMPLQGPLDAFFGLFMMAWMIPFAIVLGSVSISALARAMGSNEPIRLAHKAGVAVGGSAVAVFIVSVLAMLFGGSAGSVAGVMAAIGVLLLLAATARAGFRARTPKEARRKHTGPPPPPWAHPLARTEKVNLYAEALADQISVVTILAAAGLSAVLVNPLPLLVAGGLELMFVALVPDTDWFRRRVEQKQLRMAHEQSIASREAQLEYLASDQRQRHADMVAQVERAREAFAAADFPFEIDKLERAVDHHLWLMQLENYYADLDDDARLRQLDLEIVEAETEADGAQGRIREVLAKRVDVLHRRHAQLLDLRDRIREVADKRRTLEETLHLVTESALAGDNSFDDIDDVLLDVQSTEDVVLDLHDQDDALQREIEVAFATSEQRA